jgi:ankyrin repeat protein
VFILVQSLKRKKIIRIIFISLLVIIWLMVFVGSPLHLAAAFGNKAMVESLLWVGIQPETRASINWWTPLHAASAFGNTQNISLLIKKGANVNSHDSIDSWTPIHYAAKSGQTKAIAMLISEGADINQFHCDGDSMVTPLSLALEYRKKETAEYIMLQSSESTDSDLHTARWKVFTKLVNMMDNAGKVDSLKQGL